MDLKIPHHAIKGQDVRMECLYDLEADKLYSIKWYKNGHEFYRYIPSDESRTTIFDRPGINVDVSLFFPIPQTTTEFAFNVLQMLWIIRQEFFFGNIE